MLSVCHRLQGAIRAPVASMPFNQVFLTSQEGQEEENEPSALPENEHLSLYRRLAVLDARVEIISLSNACNGHDISRR
jgi:hypothetical protein